MNTACFIPIKANSERVPEKNLRELNGKKLYEYIVEHAFESYPPNNPPSVQITPKVVQYP